MKFQSFFWALLLVELHVSSSYGQMFQRRDSTRIRYSDNNIRKDIRNNRRIRAISNLEKRIPNTDKAESNFFSSFTSRANLKRQLLGNDISRLNLRIGSKVHSNKIREYESLNREIRRNKKRTHLLLSPKTKRSTRFFTRHVERSGVNRITLTREAKRVAERSIYISHNTDLKNVRTSFRKTRFANNAVVNRRTTRRSNRIRFNDKDQAASVRLENRLERIRTNLKINPLRETFNSEINTRDSYRRTQLRIPRLREVRRVTRTERLPNKQLSNKVPNLHRNRRQVTLNRQIMRSSYKNVKYLGSKSFLDRDEKFTDNAITIEPFKLIKNKLETEKIDKFFAKEYPKSFKLVTDENFCPANLKQLISTFSVCPVYQDNNYSNISLTAYQNSLENINEQPRTSMIQQKNNLLNPLQSFHGHLQDKGTSWASVEFNEKYKILNSELHKWFEGIKASGIINGAIVTFGLTMTAANLQKRFHLPFLDYYPL